MSSKTLNFWTTYQTPHFASKNGVFSVYKFVYNEKYNMSFLMISCTDLGANLHYS